MRIEMRIETTPEYIEREVALNKIKKLQKTDPATVGKKQFSEGYFCGLDEAEIVLLQTPTADVAEVKHGKWIKHRPNPKAMDEFHKMGIGKAMNRNSIFWTCSFCGSWGTPAHNYCPMCGAKMDNK